MPTASESPRWEESDEGEESERENGCERKEQLARGPELSVNGNHSNGRHLMRGGGLRTPGERDSHSHIVRLVQNSPILLFVSCTRGQGRSPEVASLSVSKETQQQLHVLEPAQESGMLLFLRDSVKGFRFLRYHSVHNITRHLNFAFPIYSHRPLVKRGAL